jgi:hypothetical protein
MRKAQWIDIPCSVLTAAVVLAACSRGPETQPPAAPLAAQQEGQPTAEGQYAEPQPGIQQEQERAGMAEACPMHLAGVTVQAEDLPDGVALTFSAANSAQVAELRTRVNRMAEVHNRNQARMMLPGGEQSTTGAGPQPRGTSGGQQQSGTPGQQQDGASAMQQSGASAGQQPGMHGQQPGMHGQQPGMHGQQPGMHGQQPGAQGMQQMMRAHAQAQELPNGARLVLHPQSTEQLEALREEVRQHAQIMTQSRGCPLMRQYALQNETAPEPSAAVH